MGAAAKTAVFGVIIGVLTAWTPVFGRAATPPARNAEPVFTPRPPPTPIVPTFRPEIPLQKGPPQKEPPQKNSPLRAAAPWPPPPSPLDAPDPQRPSLLTLPVDAPSPVDAPPLPAQITPPQIASPQIAPIQTHQTKPPVFASSTAPRTHSPPAANPAAKHDASPPAGRQTSRDFSEWEGACFLPEDLPEPLLTAPPGSRLRVLVDAFIRQEPSCAATIIDVLAAGEIVVAASDDKNGWRRARHPSYGTFWIGTKLLGAPQLEAPLTAAPMQQP